jgi:hypothetical protein
MNKNFVIKLEEAIMPVHDDVEVKCYPVPKNGLSTLFAGIECRKCEVVLKPINMDGWSVIFTCPDCGFEISSDDRTKLCLEYTEAIARFGGINLNKKRENIFQRFLRFLGFGKSHVTE